MKWILRLLLAMFTLMTLASIALLSPQGQKWLLKSLSPRLPDYGIYIEHLPSEFDIFSGLTWNDLSLKYVSGQTSILVQAKTLRLDYSIGFFPIKINIRSFDLSNSSITGQFASDSKQKVESKSDEFSFPNIQAENIQLQNINIDLELLNGPNLVPIQLKNLDILMQVKTNNDTLNIDQLQLNFDSVQYADYKTKNFSLKSTEKISLRCIGCKTIQFISDLNIDMRLQKIKSPMANLEELTINCSATNLNNITLTSQLKDLSSEKFIGKKPIHVYNQTLWKLSSTRADIESRIDIDQQKILNLKTTLVDGSGADISANLLLDKVLFKKIPSLYSLAMIFEKIDGQITGHIDFLDSNPKIENFKPDLLFGKLQFTTHSKLKFQTVDKGLLTIEALDLSAQTQLDKMMPQSANIDISTATLASSGYLLENFKTHIELTKKNYHVNLQGLISGGMIRKKFPFLTKTVVPKSFPTDFSPSLKIDIEGINFIDTKILAKDKGGTFSGNFEIGLTVDERLKYFLHKDQSAMAGSRRIHLSGAFTVPHQTKSLTQIKNWQHIDGKLDANIKVEDTSNNSIGLPQPATMSILTQKVGQKTSVSTSINVPKLRYASHQFSGINSAMDFTWNGRKATLESLSGSANNSQIKWNISGQLENKTGQLESQLSIRASTPMNLTPDFKVSGGVTSNIKIGITDGRDIDLTGDLEFRNFGLKNGPLQIKGMSGLAPFSESVQIGKKGFKFETLKVRNPFQRVDFRSVQPLLADKENRLQIRSIHLEERRYGPLTTIVTLDQNLLSLHSFNLTIPEGRIDGEMHIDILPRQFSMSLLSHLQNFKLSQNIPQKWVKNRSLSSDPVNARIGLITNLNRSTIEGRIDVSDMTSPQLLSILDVMDPEQENTQFITLRNALYFTAPTKTSISLHQGLMDADIDFHLAPMISVRSLTVSGQIRKSFAFITKILNGVPIQ